MFYFFNGQVTYQCASDGSLTSVKGSKTLREMVISTDMKSIFPVR